jgi:2-alkyl-3-oxoalkanoate reductase
MKLFITGASGFIGSAVVESALSRGHDVTAMVRSIPSASRRSWATHEGLTFVQGDLRHPTAWKDSLAGCDAIIHLAAAFSDFHTQFAATVVGTENLLTAMDAAECDRMVLVSTFSVYDYRAIEAGGVLDENSPVESAPLDRDDYAQTKLVQEQLVRDWAASGGRATIIRPGAVFGPGKLWSAGLALRLGGPLWAAIGPDVPQKLTYVENCAEAMVLAAEVDAAIGETLNIVDDNLPTQRDYAKAMKRAGFDVPHALPIPYGAVSAGARTFAAANKRWFKGKAKLPGFVVPAKLDAQYKPFQMPNDRAKRVLGWKPRYSLDEALARCFAAENAPRATDANR